MLVFQSVGRLIWNGQLLVKRELTLIVVDKFCDIWWKDPDSVWQVWSLHENSNQHWTLNQIPENKKWFSQHGYPKYYSDFNNPYCTKKVQLIFNQIKKLRLVLCEHLTKRSPHVFQIFLADKSITILVDDCESLRMWVVSRNVKVLLAIMFVIRNFPYWFFMVAWSHHSAKLVVFWSQEKFVGFWKLTFFQNIMSNAFIFTALMFNKHCFYILVGTLVETISNI